MMLAVAVLAVALVALWLVTVPGMMSASTYSVCAALVVALGAVVLVTYRNGQASSSMGQLLYDTDTAPAAAVVSTSGRGTSPAPKV